jgi:hypothetical protein
MQVSCGDKLGENLGAQATDIVMTPEIQTMLSVGIPTLADMRTHSDNRIDEVKET